SYAIGADALNAKAVKNIFAVKGRNTKPLPVIVPDIKTAEKYYGLGDEARKLARKFMPGRLTIAARNKYPAPLAKLLGGFRIPSHSLARAIAKGLGNPVTATSANISDKPPIYNINDAIRTFGESTALIIDAGNLPRRMPSTVFDITRKKILREGPVSMRQISRALI
ncbi:MAG: threonylcarbamoyl-AMP synthase, partial [Candidatus Aenigmarchaeota archaeon]|nr:threonylcarbamoyl-AMP synthase [Candidatus Aenigmarchaeota archaeon]